MEKHKVNLKAGERVIRCVRDHTIRQFCDLLDGLLKAPAEQTIQKQLAGLSQENRIVLRAVGIRLIDETLHNFLWMLEGGEQLELVLMNESGECSNISQLSDGLSVDMHDWIARFSKYPPSIKS